MTKTFNPGDKVKIIGAEDCISHTIGEEGVVDHALSGYSRYDYNVRVGSADWNYKSSELELLEEKLKVDQVWKWENREEFDALIKKAADQGIDWWNPENKGYSNVSKSDGTGALFIDEDNTLMNNELGRGVTHYATTLLKGADNMENKLLHTYENIGSENGTLRLHRLNGKLIVSRGCFSGTVKEFEDKVKRVHGDNEHGRKYQTIIESWKLEYGTELEKEYVLVMPDPTGEWQYVFFPKDNRPTRTNDKRHAVANGQHMTMAQIEATSKDLVPFAVEV